MIIYYYSISIIQVIDLSFHSITSVTLILNYFSIDLMSSFIIIIVPTIVEFFIYNFHFLSSVIVSTTINQYLFLFALIISIIIYRNLPEIIIFKLVKLNYHFSSIPYFVELHP